MTVEHFRREEIMLDIIERDERLAPAQRELHSKLCSEHELMVGALDNIKEIDKEYDPDDVAVTDEMKEAVGTLVSGLYAHSEEEDRELFPFVREFMTDKQLEELKIRIEE